jgi:hypothetical protein
MKEIVLKFPDVVRLTQFTLLHNIENAEADTTQYLLRVTLGDDEIRVACTEYGASCTDAQGRSSSPSFQTATSTVSIDPFVDGGPLNEPMF